LRNLKLLAYGIMQGRSGCLSTIVRQWPLGSRRHTHRLKRLHRFLSDYEWEVNLVSEGLAKVAMRFRPGGMRSKHLPIAIDWTKVHDFTVLSAAMPRRKRAIPLAHGVYLPGELRHSQNKLEVGMCTMVASWVPAEFSFWLMLASVAPSSYAGCSSMGLPMSCAYAQIQLWPMMGTAADSATSKSPMALFYCSPKSPIVTRALS